MMDFLMNLQVFSIQAMKNFILLYQNNEYLKTSQPNNGKLLEVNILTDAFEGIHEINNVNFIEVIGILS